MDDAFYLAVVQDLDGLPMFKCRKDLTHFVAQIEDRGVHGMFRILCL